MDEIKYVKIAKASGKIDYLRLDEQDVFLAEANRSHNYSQYNLVLGTVIQTGELIGLNIDFDNRMLAVSKMLEYRLSCATWVPRSPKTMASYWTIQLIDKAFRTLSRKRNKRAVSSAFSVLCCIGRMTSTEKPLVVKSLVFLNYRTEMPNKSNSCDAHFYKLCDKAEIKRFCIHDL